jgi:hypothetical protein
MLRSVTSCRPSRDRGQADEGDFGSLKIVAATVTSALGRLLRVMQPIHRISLASSARAFVMLDDPDFFFAEMDTFLAAPAELVANAPTRVG